MNKIYLDSDERYISRLRIAPHTFTYRTYSRSIKTPSSFNVDKVRISSRVEILSDGSLRCYDYIDPLPKKKNKKEEKKQSEYMTCRSDNLRRAKNKIIDYCDANSDIFCTFITLTFKDNISSIDDANFVYNSWRTYIKKIFPDFSYLCVPEFQERGAVHYHILCNIPCGSSILPTCDVLVTRNKHGKLVRNKYYKCKGWSFGFCSAFDIKKDTDSNFNVVAYICKYLYKDIDSRLFGRNKYLASRNLADVSYYLLNCPLDKFIEVCNNNYFMTDILSVYSMDFDSAFINYVDCTFSNPNNYLQFLFDRGIISLQKLKETI